MLVDEIKIIFKAGHGGAGKVSFYPRMGAGPDGGNGGRGGDVYLLGTPDITALDRLSGKTMMAAENGEAGDKNKKSGKSGSNLEVLIPIGSNLTDQKANQTIEITAPGQKILIVKGGLGGKGNFEFRSSRNTTPRYAQPGLPGEEKHFLISLRLIADFGLVGLPNAGKSSLLNELTKANVRVGVYPFTTLEPNLGVYQEKVLADIPGLIEGASAGKGLGIKFLKHIEKVRTLLHLISVQSDDIERDYQIIRTELGKFNPELLKKKEIVLLTKTDLTDRMDLAQQLKLLRNINPLTFPLSLTDEESLRGLKKLLD